MARTAGVVRAAKTHNMKKEFKEIVNNLKFWENVYQEYTTAGDPRFLESFLLCSRSATFRAAYVRFKGSFYELAVASGYYVNNYTLLDVLGLFQGFTEPRIAFIKWNIVRCSNLLLPRFEVIVQKNNGLDYGLFLPKNKKVKVLVSENIETAVNSAVFVEGRYFTPILVQRKFVKVVVDSKTPAAHMVLDLMDHDASYEEALRLTLAHYPEIIKEYLELELSFYC